LRQETLWKRKIERNGRRVVLRKIMEMTPEKLDQAVRGANEEWLAKHVAESDALRKEEAANMRKFIAKLRWPPATLRIRCACGQTIRLARITTRDGAEIYQDICSYCYTLWEVHGATVSGGWNRHIGRKFVPPIMRPVVWPRERLKPRHKNRQK
jgi:hypothetical protein